MDQLTGLGVDLAFNGGRNQHIRFLLDPGAAIFDRYPAAVALSLSIEPYWSVILIRKCGSIPSGLETV